MALPKQYQHPYEFDPKYSKSVAYFSMEFAIHQSLKTYSGGLGFLSGSHVRSAYDLKQNLVGISILWKYGYYDQVRKGDQSMDVLFQEKTYGFLEETKIKFSIEINNHPVIVKAYFLNPRTFGTVPIFFLTTDVPENDYLARSTSFKLYDSDPSARIAQFILLGVGGARLLDELGHDVETYHLNEAHGLSAAFYLYKKFGNLEEVKKRLVFTTHTPEEAGNETHDIRLLEKMGFFSAIPHAALVEITGITDEVFSHTLVALRMANSANAVSRKHGEIANKMWKGHKDVCKIISITNAQNKKYWADKILYEALEKADDNLLRKRKLQMKENLFEEVADQQGQLFNRETLTIVWSRRYAGYKRADLITQDSDRFHNLITSKTRPIQIIWAGKPYPVDYSSISVFNQLVHLSKKYPNVAVLVGYELKLSKILKSGADIWLNNPRIPHEASGTSGMTASMNGAINFSTYDGWIPEFAKHGVNSFIVPPVDPTLPLHQQDQIDAQNLLDVL
ncbi:MAG TPA: alpha-glucan family phosphorylase, partial [Cyclobacteriaceae bacterium]|nr:alpha-glucan family phosphorylase [Cyclobacteriaceae bacterium]